MTTSIRNLGPLVVLGLSTVLLPVATLAAEGAEADAAALLSGINIHEDLHYKLMLLEVDYSK